MFFEPTLAYVGPDVILPVTSAIAAIAGGVMMFWRYIAVMVSRSVRFLRRK